MAPSVSAWHSGDLVVHELTRERWTVSFHGDAHPKESRCLEEPPIAGIDGSCRGTDGPWATAFSAKAQRRSSRRFVVVDLI